MRPWRISHNNGHGWFHPTRFEKKLFAWLSVRLVLIGSQLIKLVLGNTMPRQSRRWWGAGLRPLLSSSTVTWRDSWQVTYRIHQFWSAFINLRWEDRSQLAKPTCWTHWLLKAARNSDRSQHWPKVAQWEGRGAGRTRKTASVCLCFAYTANKYHNQAITIIG